MRKLKLQELNRPDVDTYRATDKLPLVLVLDDIRSALNVGSLFRTADAMGIAEICLCGITATPPSREITKTAIGATESVAWQYYEDVTVALASLSARGFHILTIEQTDRSVKLTDFDASKHEQIAVIVGNEVYGVSESAIAKSHEAVEIAQYGTKHSLNVSVCGGIVLHHLSHQMRKLP